MAKDRDKQLYIVDHANKSADRQRKNPNRSLAKRGPLRRKPETEEPALDDKPEEKG